MYDDGYQSVSRQGEQEGKKKKPRSQPKFRVRKSKTHDLIFANVYVPDFIVLQFRNCTVEIIYVSCSKDE